MKTYQLTVSTPDGNVFSGQCQSLSVRGTEGSLAIMAGHVPFVTGLVGGECMIVLENGEEKRASLDGGVLTADRGSVTVLAGSFRFEE